MRKIFHSSQTMEQVVRLTLLITFPIGKDPQAAAADAAAVADADADVVVDAVVADVDGMNVPFLFPFMGK